MYKFKIIKIRNTFFPIKSKANSKCRSFLFLIKFYPLSNSHHLNYFNFILWTSSFRLYTLYSNAIIGFILCLNNNSLIYLIFLSSGLLCSSYKLHSNESGYILYMALIPLSIFPNPHWFEVLHGLYLNIFLHWAYLWFLLTLLKKMDLLQKYFLKELSHQNLSLLLIYCSKIPYFAYCLRI